MMVGEMYNKMKADHRMVKDWKLPVVIIVGVGGVAVLSWLIISVLLTQYKFNRFKYYLNESVVYSITNNTFAFLENDKMLNHKRPEKLWEVLGKNGKQLKEKPKEKEDAKVVFGDGSVLCIWDSTFEDRSDGHGAVEKPGIIMYYENNNGFIFCVNAEEDYDYLTAYLGGEIANYYLPTETELMALEEKTGKKYRD